MDAAGRPQLCLKWEAKVRFKENLDSFFFLRRKPKFLCLHRFRTNGEIMKTQIEKRPKSVLNNMDLVYVDAPFPCQGKSDVEAIFDPPYYELVSIQGGSILYLEYTYGF
ncbi:hypothetical protein LguiA_016588 [Lonicera macranthoides]